MFNFNSVDKSKSQKNSKMAFSLSVYLGKKFFASVFTTSLVLGGFVFLLDFIEMLRKVSDVNGADSADALLMSLFKMPDMLLQIAPFAVLIGTIICFARLTANQELTAIRAAGLPARKFLIPPMLVCIAIGIINLVAINPFSATMLKKYERTHNDLFPGSTQGLVTKGGEIWLKQHQDGQNIFIYANSVKDTGRELTGATVFRYDKSTGAFIERSDASRMILTPGKWRMYEVKNILSGGEFYIESFSTLDTDLTPAMIRGSFTSPATLSVFDLPEFIEVLEQTGFPTSEHQFKLQQLFAMPALMLAMFLLAAPFALHFSRTSGLGVILISGLCFGFTFYLFANFIGTYGLAGRLDITMAAWAPTFIATLIGISLFLHYREE